MKKMNTDLEIITYDKKFGLLTNNEIILSLKKGNKKIALENINHVSLNKKRIYFSNALLFVAGVAILYFTRQIFNEYSFASYGLLGIGVYLIVSAFLHKFYYYHFVVTESNYTVHKITTPQWNREKIKEFYFGLKSLLKKRKKED